MLYIILNSAKYISNKIDGVYDGIFLCYKISGGVGGVRGRNLLSVSSGLSTQVKVEGGEGVGTKLGNNWLS